ncbi:MAG: hypothetical protein AB2531_08910, partial [Candidatus Thiodiazotropha sp.]
VCHASDMFINEIPDYTQSNIIGKGTGDGQQYCGPVAISNTIIWLNKNRGNQEQLILKLASKPFMNTSLKNGTGVTGITRGIAKISNELFGGYKVLEYEGWRKHPKQYSTDVKLPSENRLTSAINQNSAAWLNIGWYRYNEANNEFIRIGGHWVTLVGSKYGQFIIHDPAPRAGKHFSNEFVDYSILRDGTLVGKKWGMPFPAKGLISLESGMHKKKGADFAIVDGVVYLEI